MDHPFLLKTCIPHLEVFGLKGVPNVEIEESLTQKKRGLHYYINIMNGLIYTSYEQDSNLHFGINPKLPSFFIYRNFGHSVQHPSGYLHPGAQIGLD